MDVARAAELLVGEQQVVDVSQAVAPGVILSNVGVLSKCQHWGCCQLKVILSTLGVALE